MKLKLCVCGRLRKGPEFALFKEYLTRSEKIGKLINLSSITVLEYDTIKWMNFLKDRSLSKAVSARAHKVLLDEKGKIFSSKSFTQTLKIHRDNGTPEFVFFIGGAEGVPESVISNFDEVMSLGRMVWPHFLARVMLMEQIYRANTILAGLPYHKE